MEQKLDLIIRKLESIEKSQAEDRAYNQKTSNLIIEEIELDNGYVHHSQNKRSLSSFVWANHDLLQYGTDTVLVTAGSHE